jgi:hypothetical protein
MSTQPTPISPSGFIGADEVLCVPGLRLGRVIARCVTRRWDGTYRVEIATSTSEALSFIADRAGIRATDGALWWDSSEAPQVMEPSADFLAHWAAPALQAMNATSEETNPQRGGAMVRTAAALLLVLAVLLGALTMAPSAAAAPNPSAPVHRLADGDAVAVAHSGPYCWHYRAHTSGRRVAVLIDGTRAQRGAPCRGAVIARVILPRYSHEDSLTVFAMGGAIHVLAQH